MPEIERTEAVRPLSQSRLCGAQNVIFYRFSIKHKIDVM